MSDQQDPDTEATLIEGRDDETERVFALLTSYKGPLPPPAVLREYEEIVPGGARLIFEAFTAQTTHRHSLETTVINGNVQAQLLGVKFAGLIALLAVAGGIWLAAHDKPTAGIATIVTALVALVGAFVYGRRQQARDLADKRKKADQS